MSWWRDVLDPFYKCKQDRVDRQDGIYMGHFACGFSMAPDSDAKVEVCEEIAMKVGV